MLIITGGMIGVGKTTLTKLLAEHYDSQPFYEPVKGNPILPLFYKDQRKYGFLLQIYFLNKRFAMIKEALDNDNNVLDRSIYEDKLFTKINMEAGNIIPEEFETYSELLDNMLDEIENRPKSRPDLLVYASADFDTILKRIKKRGRKDEQINSENGLRDYYKKIWEGYEQWYEEYDKSPKIKIDLVKYDLSIKKNREKVLEIVDAKLKSIEI